MGAYNKRFKEDIKNYRYMFMFSKEDAKLIIELLERYEEESPPTETKIPLSQYMKEEIENQYYDIKRRYQEIWNAKLNI